MTMWPEGPAGPRSGSEWADVVRARLFEQRTILLRGELTDIAASEAGAGTSRRRRPCTMASWTRWPPRGG